MSLGPFPILLIPSTKNGKLQFWNDLTQQIIEAEFSRPDTDATSGATVMRNGQLIELAEDQPDWDDADGCPVIKMRPQRANNFQQTEGTHNFTTLGRLNCGYTLGAGFNSFSTSCLSTSTAFTSSVIRPVLRFTAVVGEVSYFTIRVKKKEGWYLKLDAVNGAEPGGLSVNISSSGGFIDATGSCLTNYQVNDLTDCWEIGFYVESNANTTGGLIVLAFYPNSTFATYDDTGGTEIFISAVQEENQATYGTSYIPRLTSTAVTRARNEFNFPDLINKGSISANGNFSLLISFGEIKHDGTSTVSGRLRNSGSSDIIRVNALNSSNTLRIFNSVTVAYEGPSFSSGDAFVLTIENEVFKIITSAGIQSISSIGDKIISVFNFNGVALVDLKKIVFSPIVLTEVEAIAALSQL
jgi:hypothetical protein